MHSSREAKYMKKPGQKRKTATAISISTLSLSHIKLEVGESGRTEHTRCSRWDDLDGRDRARVRVRFFGVENGGALEPLPRN